MKGKFQIWYDLAYSGDDMYEACALLPHGNLLMANGQSWEEAKQKLIEKITAIPKDEWIEI